MNVLFQLDCVTQLGQAYKTCEQELSRALKQVASLKKAVAKTAWSGEGREQFDATVEQWIQGTQNVMNELVYTAQGVIEQAGQGGNELKKIREKL